jgi:Cu+-exporting ATPase
MDSFAGFIFFLLIGKWFQNLTYASLSFDRDFSSFFPVAIQRIKPDLSKEIVPIEQLQIDELIEVRNEEIIPCDSELLSEETFIDYSFVTGEAQPVLLKKGALVYAGGQVQGLACRLKVKATTNRSHLTQLWNETKDKTPKNQLIRYQDRLSRYFLLILLLIASVSGVAWYFVAPSAVFRVVVAILIVACPCALALSAPFTSIDTIVLDKTGTLTDPNSYQITVAPHHLTDQEFTVFVNMARQSTHPLSKALASAHEAAPELELLQLEEIKGQGMRAEWNGETYLLGSAAFIGEAHLAKGSELFLKTAKNCAHLRFESSWRSAAIQSILDGYGATNCYVLSGDHNQDSTALMGLGFLKEHLFFELSPQQKAVQIQQLQKAGKQVLYIGDGLNDVGALGTAAIGLALSEDMFRFTPSADGILEAKSLVNLIQMLRIGRYAKLVLQICLAFSLSYNIFGLSIAISGQLTPLIAAILMPISSITIVLLSTVLIQAKYKRSFKS